MRIFLSVAMFFLAASCSGKSYPPVARVDIRISVSDQAEVIEAMKAFGSREGFEVLAGDRLPKQGRFVSQITLQRNDGLVVSSSNFMKADTLQTFFYAEQSNADWRSVKEAWMREITKVLNGRGEIVEVPVSPEP